MLSMQLSNEISFISNNYINFSREVHSRRINDKGKMHISRMTCSSSRSSSSSSRFNGFLNVPFSNRLLQFWCQWPKQVACTRLAKLWMHFCVQWFTHMQYDVCTYACNMRFILCACVCLFFLFIFFLLPPLSRLLLLLFVAYDKTIDDDGETKVGWGTD